MNDLLIAMRDEDPTGFHSRFWRSHRLLHTVACRILGGPERADNAIENCWLRASRNPPRFEHQGAFRSWLVRVLIEEALAILHKNRESTADKLAAVKVLSDRDLGTEPSELTSRAGRSSSHHHLDGKRLQVSRGFIKRR